MPSIRRSLPLNLRTVAAAALLSLCAACSPGAAPAHDGGAPVDDAGQADDDAGQAFDDAGQAGDAGQPDAGVPCPAFTAPLGTATLGAGFTIVDDVMIPATTFAIAAVAESADAGTYRVYAVDSASGAVVDHGVWPDLDAAPAEVFDVVPASETATDVLPSFLAAGDGRLFAGYSSFTGGAIAVRDLATSTTTYVDAAANFMGTPYGDALLVQAAGLDDVGGAAAEVYAWMGLDGASPTAKIAVDLPADAYSGIAVVTGGGVPLLGAFTADGNVVRAFAPTAIDAALAGTAAAFATGTPVTVGAFSFAAAFGEGAVFSISEDFVFVSELVHVPVTASGSTVTVGAPATVLTMSNACSQPQYGLLAPIGDDLLVGMAQQDGLHLVRIAAP